uniref:Conotoxin tx3d n=3 Tax=Conus TaxID=6490 RepID=M3D_CONTE|nr:RecName: Full=Conotoxin tx3d; AltName: Full=Conotoxin 1 [Conus textile]
GCCGAFACRFGCTPCC